MSGDFPSNTDSSGLLWQAVGQWKVWILAAIAAVIAFVMLTRTEGTFFHGVWFGLVAVGSVLYALWNIEGVSTLG
ncbi:MAG: hypothetical protein ABEI11_04735 [Haloarculaceae archaeon]